MKTNGELQRDVLDELEWEPSVTAAHIGVSVSNGIVALTGHVPSFAEKLGAERAAKRVYGVKAVADELTVNLPGESVRTDSEIAAACLHALDNNQGVPPDKITVVVSNGWVTLEGQVEWQFQKNAADNTVRYLVGVVGVTDQIKVKPRARANDVSVRIMEAFRRNAELDARRIMVEAQDGKVVLKGHVRSFAEREEAQLAAWAAPGVNAVENDLVVAL